MVDPILGAAAISAGASLFGGLLGKSSEDSSNRINAEQAELDRAYQKEFAQMGIKWRVDDAQSAGVHPLYALGANIPTYSPTRNINTPSTSLAKGFSTAGQNISRAVAATQTAQQRQLGELQIERATLENIDLSNKIGRSQIGPSFPSSAPNLGGQGASNQIIDLPQQRTAPNPERRHQEPGAIVDLGFVRTATGFAPVPSKDVKERVEDMFIPETMWSWRNYGMANLGQNPPPESWLRPGGHWKWSQLAQEWQDHYPGPPSRRPRRKRHGGAKKAYRGRSFTKGKIRR